MPLGSLAHFETEKLVKERENLLSELKVLKEILVSETKQKEILVEQLSNIKKKFSDPRRTVVLHNAQEKFSEEDTVLKEKILITLSSDGYIKRVPLSSFRLQKRNVQGKRGLSFTEDDSLKLIKISSTHDDLLFFTNKGKCYRKKAYKIPEYECEARGIPVINVIETLEKEEIVQEILVDEPSTNFDLSLFFVTKKAIVKKTKLSEFSEIRKTGKIAISLRKNDKLRKVLFVKENTEVFISSYRGKVVRFNADDEIKLTSRDTIGVIGMQLQKGDFVSGADTFDKEQNKNYVLTVSESGIGKLISEDKFLVAKRFCAGK
jgi:DNA gyrase subunit A